MHLIKRTNISVEARKNINIQYEKELIKISFNNLKRMKIATEFHAAVKPKKI